MLQKDDLNVFGGINIEEAKLFMQNEREYDKQLDKARIKRMHAEKRFKEKEIRRAKRHKNNDGEENKFGQVTLGAGDFNEENDGNESYDEDMMHQEIDLNE